jgi:hypothetical protein
MREVTLRIRHHGEPESDISADYPAVTIESVSSMTGSAAERKRIIAISGPADAVASFLADFETAEAVLEVDRLTPLSVPRVLVALTFDSYRWDSIAQRLTDMGIHYRTGTTINAGWERWTLYLDDSDDLSDIVASLERAGNDTDIVRDVSLGELDGSEQLELSGVVDDLTDRQREVLATAIGAGYYRPKRDATIEEIADMVGVAPTTAWEHLVRAEAKVMAEMGKHLTPPRTGPSASG